MKACFLTGPVAVARAVHHAFGESPASHRDPAFIDAMRRTRAALTALANASNVVLMLGSGTLANDAVGAQLAELGRPGLILVNGEFGERLVDHALRWNLPFTVERERWGESFDWAELRRIATNRRPAWIWAVLTETSTGVANPLPELRAMSALAGAALCIDAVSAIGLMPVDLDGVRFATAVSGKGLAAYPGLCAVYHDGQLARSARIPRYLDLAAYEDANGVPFTHSSNLLRALECSLSRTCWPEKFRWVEEESRWLRAELTRFALPPVALERNAAAGVVTLEIPCEIHTADVATALDGLGFEIAWQSQYLVERNWMQIALMGAIDAGALRALPSALGGCVQYLAGRGFRGKRRAHIHSALGVDDRRRRPASLPRIVADAIDGGAFG